MDEQGPRQARSQELEDDDTDEVEAIDTGELGAYLVEEIVRALKAHGQAERGTVQRQLVLGEALALFNLADQFGLVDPLRATLDRRLGRDAYLLFSAAMKDALLDQGFGPAVGGRPTSGPGASRPDRPRPGGTPARPPANAGPRRPPRPDQHRGSGGRGRS